jgi:hypothetical protein
MSTPIKALFILKRREDYSTDLPNFGYHQVATGMYNSSLFVSDMLEATPNVSSSVVLAQDANSIDKLVFENKPTHVFIEGYWVVPSKFDELKRLHPKVKWVVRCHSELPFLAQEGIAMTWTFDYFRKGVLVAGNSPRINRELQLMASVVCGNEMPLLPNFYPVSTKTINHKDSDGDGDFHVGCFGAIRPLKNQLTQALAAYEFSKKNRFNLKFHVNAGRVEMNGQNPLKNIRGLFDNLPDAELVEHGWTSHDEFVKIVRSMDVVMQVSFSETFNIVAADAVNQDVPVIASSEIDWLYPIFAEPTSTESMVQTLDKVWTERKVVRKANKVSLQQYCARSRKLWLTFLRK